MPERSQSVGSPYEIRYVERILFGEVVGTCLAPLCFFLIILITVDGLIPQIEMFLFGGSIPFPMMIIKAALILLLALSTAIGGWKNDLLPIWSWLAFAVYLMADIPHLLAQQLGFSVVLSGYYGYYSLVLILPFLGVTSSKLDERHVTRVLYAVFWVCAAMGIAQHLFNSPILPTHSSDGSFEVITWVLFGTGLVRSFSFFVYSVNFGLFCTFVGAMGLYSFLIRKTNWGGLAAYCVAALCVYCTLTRVVYLVFVIASLSVFVLCYGKTLKLLRYLPLVGFGLGGAVAYGGALFLNSKTGIADNLSLLQRIEQLAYYWSVFIGGNFSQRLLGIGYVQDSKVNGQAIYPIDNLYMALLLHIGIVGLIVFLVFCWQLYNRIIGRAKEKPTPLRAGVCAVWSSFLAISLFDISVAFFACCAILFMLGSDPTSGSDRPTADSLS